MLILINTNRMQPPIAPVGLDYVAGAARAAGIETDVLDLCLALPAGGGQADEDAALRQYFSAARPRLVGLSFRNIDDCFWPSGATFVPPLVRTVQAIRGLTDAPIVLGGVGYSIFADRILQETGADYGVRGDGEEAVVALARELEGSRRMDLVPGLLWQQDGRVCGNRPAWPARLAVPTARDAIDNAAYFRLGGHVGVETKRGCDHLCIFCADPLAKGAAARVRPPSDVAEEVESLLRQGVDVLHICDGEFNVPLFHARAVCEEFIRRGLGERVRWYAYLAVTPLEAELVSLMRRAGCAGINFTAPAASDEMLAAYRQPHRCADIATAVRFCREAGVAVMVDVMLGGPGETPETVAAAIRFLKETDPDCAGVGLGVRLHPEFPITRTVAAEGPMEANPAIRRHYAGPIDLLKPTFYISHSLGPRPAAVVRRLVGGDPRFFEPEDEPEGEAQPSPGAAEGGEPEKGYNYNDNAPLERAIAAGARGAYWDILRKLRGA